MTWKQFEKGNLDHLATGQTMSQGQSQHAELVTVVYNAEKQKDLDQRSRIGTRVTYNDR